MIILFALFWFLQAKAVPIELGPETFPFTPNTILFGRAAAPTCICDGSDTTDRTLYEIVRSCLLTIAACVYRSIHPNIPDPTASWWRRQWTRLKITFYALITPEMMIWWAMRQWFGAQIVANRVNALHWPGLRWTRTHGYFAIMGGFARKDTKQVLHPTCLIKLLREGLIDAEDLRLSQEDIDDRSKGDVLSKALVGLQTSWFIFECLARWQQRLPLTELEVVTVAFAVLNVFIYLFWWRKPLNVNRPTYVKVFEPPGTTCQCADPAYVELDDEMDEKKRTKGILGALWDGLANAAAAMIVAIRDGLRGLKETWSSLSLQPVRDAWKSVKKRYRADMNTLGFRGMVWTRTIKQPFSALAWPLWNLLQDHEAHHEKVYVSTFYGIKIPDETLLAVHLLSCFIGMIFGAIHFLSWNSRFPTHSDLLLWRTSSVVLVVQPLILASGGLLIAFETGRDKTKYTKWLNSSRYLSDEENRKEINFKSWKVISLISGALSTTLGVIAYILARFCVLVLAFVTLHALPAAVFDNVSWTTYIPHF